MGLGIPPLKIKIVLESNPPKPTMLVGRLCVLRLHNQMHLLMIFPRQSRQVPRAADPWRRCGHWRQRTPQGRSLAQRDLLNVPVSTPRGSPCSLVRILRNTPLDLAKTPRGKPNPFRLLRRIYSQTLFSFRGHSGGKIRGPRKTPR